MAKKKRRKKNSTEKLKLTLKYELIGLTIIGLAIIAIAKLGAVGNGTVFLIRFFMGEWYILFLLGAIAAGFYLMIKREVPYLLKRQLVGMYFLVASMLLLSHVTLFNMLADGGPFTKPSVISNTWELFWMEVTGKASSKDLGGGMIGAILFAASYFLFDEAGSKIVSFLFIIVGAVLLTGKTLGETLGKFFRGLGGFFKKQWSAFRDDVKTWNEDKKEKKKNPVKKKKRQNEPVEETDQPPLEEETQEMATERIISSFADKAYSDENEVIPVVTEPAAENAEDQDDAVPPMNFTEVENKEYLLPPLSLLLQPKKTDQSGEYQLIHENAAKLERTFHSFGVKARVTQVHLGPAVTKYEVHPDVGVKVSKIVSLSDDLALALAAKDIRIEAPIPGKSAIGIEVPNSEVAMVSLREVLEAKEVDKPDAKLQIGLGRNISGEAVKADIFPI